MRLGVCENACDFLAVHLGQKIDQKKRLERIEQSVIWTHLDDEFLGCCIKCAAFHPFASEAV